MPESIFVLTHADETGSALTRASLEAVTAGKELAAQLGAPLMIGILAPDSISVADTLAEAGVRVFGVSGEYVLTGQICERHGRVRSAL